MKIIKEVCVENFSEALLAAEAGADRIELCDNLAVGGTTVSAATLALSAEKLSVPYSTLIRPRAGNFIYNDDEKNIILGDIAFADDFHPEGLVVGALCGSSFDIPFMQEMRDLIKNSKAVCHMAFDDTQNLEESLEILIELGYDRVLTKGGVNKAPHNIDMLKKLVDIAGDRITVMIGGGVTAENYLAIAEATGAKELHGTKIL
ncbi:MAG: copper homeostasis protein CutC [Brevinema sp.]